MDSVKDSQIKLVSEALHLLVLKLRVDRMDTWSEKLRGMTPLQLHILKLVQDRPNLVLKEIREEFGIPQSTLTSAIDRLSEHGLIKRVINERDLRSFGLELTEAGCSIQEEHERVDGMVAAKLIQCLDSEEKREAICVLLKEIGERLR